MAITSGYRYKDYPVAAGIHGSFLSRVQSVDFSRDVPTITHYELGNEEPVGVSADPEINTARITWLPVDNKVESIILGVTDISDSAPKGLLDFINAPPIQIVTPKDSLSGARLSSLEYSLTIGGEFTATATFEGTSFGPGSVISVVNPTGRGAYRSPDFTVTVGGTQVARAQGFAGRAALRTNRLYEIGSNTPVAVEQDMPTSTISIDWVESDAATGTTFIPLGMPVDIVVNIPGVKKLTWTNCVTTNVGPRGMVNGYATRRLTYTSKGDNTFGGFKIGRG